MIKKSQHGFSFFNFYSIALIVFYFLYFILNTVFFYSIPASALFITFPLIWCISFWSSQIASYKKEIKNELNSYKEKKEFWRDLFLINYGFIISQLISFDIHFSNVDIRGWWPIILYHSELIALFYAFIYSLFAMFLKSHHKYTFVFFFLICLTIIGISVIDYYNPLSFYAGDKFFYFILGGLLLIHIITCITYKLIYKIST